MFEEGKLETRQANIAVSPSYTSADLTPGIWGETGMHETFCILEYKEKKWFFVLFGIFYSKLGVHNPERATSQTHLFLDRFPREVLIPNKSYKSVF